MRDIAGMLRSFDYAGHHMVTDGGSAPQRMYRANEWSERNRDAFCDGYAEAAGDDPRASGGTLARVRGRQGRLRGGLRGAQPPGWLPIPLASLARLANPKKAS